MVNWNTASSSSDNDHQSSQRASSSQSQLVSVPIPSPTLELGVNRSPTSHNTRYAPYSGPRSPPSPELRHRRHVPDSRVASRDRAILPIHSKPQQNRDSRESLLPPVNELSIGRPLSATESRALLHRLRVEDAKQPSIPSPTPPGTAALSHQATLLDQEMRRRSEILLAGGCATEAPSLTA